MFDAEEFIKNAKEVHEVVRLRKLPPIEMIKHMSSMGNGTYVVYLPMNKGYEPGTFVKVNVSRIGQKWKDPVTFVTKCKSKGYTVAITIPHEYRDLLPVGEDLRFKIYEYDPTLEAPEDEDG